MEKAIQVRPEWVSTGSVEEVEHILSSYRLSEVVAEVAEGTGHSEEMTTEIRRAGEQFGETSTTPDSGM